MKTFKEFITEEEEVAGDLKDLIEAQCPGFLKRTGHNGLLFRGVSNAGKLIGRYRVGDDTTVEVFRKAVRKDRETVSMHPAVSKVIDDWFDENFGFRARSQALFCYGEKGRRSAFGYGSRTLMVFPIGEFSFVWSPNINDLYDALGPISATEAERIEAFMEQQGYTNNHLIGRCLVTPKS